MTTSFRTNNIYFVRVHLDFVFDVRYILGGIHVTQVKLSNNDYESCTLGRYN